MKQPQWFSLLGLAARARMLATGEELVIKSIRKKEVYLVIVADDASESTKKKLQDKCNFYNVTLKFAADRGQLGAAIGKHERVVIGVTDKGFAQKLLSIL
ncbi:YlxQ family RNA-binding protein [Anaerobacillus isosaccharinicus]|uniref:50S ribosomal protein L7 n=1 Tax=Anaerobacillus isosaccharinicus TaxID=1532552 RepID=A0A1S2M902_9BACI|nr:YlxQ family RNA-binding protein [Anaerobacillus isosaccharinicus]MBA5587293.1 YlxQ family RNA-binding protein [Anaerobacillus isosaccharinicus]QOY34515.1 YlxQ family RNA-binding protein [Anaerobacillus isosaccharinicus]